MDEYLRRCPSRRSILAGLSAGGIVLAGIVSRPSGAAQGVAETDPRVTTQTLTVTGASGYLAAPKTGGKHAAIVVMHDRQGMTPHVRNITRVLAAAGYVAWAPDLTDRLATLTTAETVALQRAAIAALRERPDHAGRIGALGFGWGGTAVNHLALGEPTLKAVVAYYGLQALYYQEDDYRRVGAAMLHHYAGRDTLNNQGIDNFQTGLRDVGKSAEVQIYAGMDRGFDDPDSATYNAAAANLAWARTSAFFKKHLG